MSISMTANVMLRMRMQPKYCLWRAVHTSTLVSPRRIYVSKTLPALLGHRTFAGHSHGRTHEHTHKDNDGKIIGSHSEHSHSHLHSHTDHSHLVESLSMSSSNGTRITLIGLAANVGLTVSKGAAGILMNSASLVADAAHSLSDLVSDFVTLYTYRMSRRPPDISHPYGYGKYETAGSFAVSSLLIIGALGIGWHSYEMLINVLANAGESSAVLVDAQKTVDAGLTVATSIFEHHHGDGVLNPNAAWFALASVGVKEWLYRATIKIGKMEKSDVLIANAWHHRSDSFSSMVALVAIGGSYMGLPILDPLGGILVAGMILKSGVEILVSASKELLDAGEISEEVVNDVQKAITDVKNIDANIIDFHSIRGRKTGPFYLIDLILHVNPEMTVAKAHVLEDTVRKSVLVHVPEVKEVLIHLDSETMDAKHLRVGRQDTI